MAKPTDIPFGFMMVEKGLVSTNGDLWKRQRLMLGTPFHY
jgi:hypothetical protein